MRALPFVAAALAWSAVALADPPPSPAPSLPPPMTQPPPSVRATAFPGRFSTPRQFHPKLGNAIRPAASASASATPPTPPAPTAPGGVPVGAPPTPFPSRPVPIVLAPAAAAPPPPRPHRKPRPRKPAPPALPAPALTLTIDAVSPEAPWTLRAENTGAIPLRIAADARLVALDITLAGAKHAIKCELPSSMRPDDDDDRSLVLPPGRAFAEKIDPRLFCFGERNAAALVAGASVVPRLVGSRDVSVVGPIEEVEPVVATAHEWTGTASTIGAAVVAPAKDAARTRTLALTTPAFLDVDRATEVALPITAKNESNAPFVFLFRPETVALDVTGPSGIGVTDPSPTVRCAWAGPPPSPILELFAHLAPNGSNALSVLPSVLCPEGTLDRRGLYVVRARLDTRRTSGTPIGLHTFDGELAAGTTTRLRVRETTGRPPPSPRPQLEAVTAH